MRHQRRRPDAFRQAHPRRVFVAPPLRLGSHRSCVGATVIKPSCDQRYHQKRRHFAPSHATRPQTNHQAPDRVSEKGHAAGPAQCTPPGHQLVNRAGAALICRTPRQPLCTGHVDASLENSSHWLHRRGPPSPAADTSVSLRLSARLPRATPRPTRKQAGSV